jgi:hypothetical protein
MDRPDALELQTDPEATASIGWFLRRRMFYHNRIYIRPKWGGLKSLQPLMRGGKMKGQISAKFLVGVLATLLIGIVGFAQQNKQTKTIKGEVVDLWCYMDHSAHGEKHKACAIACAKMGNPIGIVDSEGNVYVAVGAELHQPYRDELIEKMAQEVTVTGTVESRGGMKMIYVKTIS